MAKNSRLSGAMAPLGFQFWMHKGLGRPENLDKCYEAFTPIYLKAMLRPPNPRPPPEHSRPPPQNTPRTIENLANYIEGLTIIMLKALKCKTALEVLQSLAKNSRLSGAMAPLGFQFWMHKGWGRAENLDKCIGQRATVNLKSGFACPSVEVELGGLSERFLIQFTDI